MMTADSQSQISGFSDPPIQPVTHPLLSKYQVSLDVLRLDAIHPEIHGNKWFKLKHNLATAVEQGHHQVLSFGGAYSNHLYALAAATAAMGLSSIGIVRGELPSPLNPVLAKAQRNGMLLQPLSRGRYREKMTSRLRSELRQQHGDFYFIPEGGSNEAGVKGCEDIVDLLKPWMNGKENERTVVAMACGTGATLAGMIRGVSKRRLNVDLLGIAVLKGAGFLQQDIAGWLKGMTGSRVNWRIELNYHGGGYARVTDELAMFTTTFGDQQGILLEPVYTGKMLFALFDLVRRQKIPPATRILALHTGGIY